MLEDVSAVWRQSCCERSHHEIPKRSIHFEITMKGPQDMKKQEWKGVLCESLTDHIHSLCRTPHLAGFSSNGLLQITDFTALSAHPAPSVANESICCMLLQPLKLQMTERKGECIPAALCVEIPWWLVQAALHQCRMPRGSPAFIRTLLPFEMLLQLPEQKLHCYVVMALRSCSPRSHGAVSQQDHIGSRGVCPQLLCVVRVLQTPSCGARSNESTDLGHHPTAALTRAAAWGNREVPG